MTDIIDYAKTRNVAIAITLVILMLGSAIYFATSIADRNNEMMYKEIYGENATIKNIVIDDNNDSVDNTKNTKTALV